MHLKAYANHLLGAQVMAIIIIVFLTFKSLLQAENSMTGTEHEIRTEKCSDTCQHKIKFVLTFSRNDQMLIEICIVALYFGSDICQIKLEFVHVNAKSARKMSDVRLLFHALQVEHTWPGTSLAEIH